MARCSGAELDAGRTPMVLACPRRSPTSRTARWLPAFQAQKRKAPAGEVAGADRFAPRSSENRTARRPAGLYLSGQMRCRRADRTARPRGGGGMIRDLVIDADGHCTEPTDELAK